MLKVAILGYGFMGKTHADAYTKIPNTRITAIGEVNKDVLEKAQSHSGTVLFSDLAELVRDADADVIDICLPTFLHRKFVIAAARSGRHILCEKPFALSTADAEGMLAEVSAAGVTLMVAQVLRFFPHYRKVKELLDSGAIGAVFSAEASRISEPPKWAEWFRDPTKSGGALYDLQIHDLDYLLWLFGLPTSVFAAGTQIEGGCWDDVTTLLRYEDKVVTTRCSYRMPQKWPFTTFLRIAGTKGCIEYEFRVDGNVESIAKAEQSLTLFRSGDVPMQVDVEEQDPYLAELQYFLNCIRDKKVPSEISTEESLRVIHVLDCALASLRSGAPVKPTEVSQSANEGRGKAHVE